MTHLRKLPDGYDCRLPHGVVMQWAEEWMWETKVLPAEEGMFTGASEKRCREFRAGRHTARAALARAGYVGCEPILRGERGEPVWPAGYCGSISHSGDVCMAVAASIKEFAGIGVDIEKNKPLKKGVIYKIATEKELDQIATLQEYQDKLNYDALLFSIKETVYKIYYPIERQWLGFKDVEAVIDREKRQFVCRIISNSRTDRGVPEKIYGQFGFSPKFIIALATVSESGDLV